MSGGVSKVLLVEDNDDLLGTLKKVLESDGFEVVAACNVGEAVAALDREAHIDCVVVDFWLGDSVGTTFIDALRARFSDVPVLMVTGGGGSLTIDTVTDLAEMSGAERVLYKPFSNKEFLYVIHTLLK